jgi:hypothetical protein
MRITLINVATSSQFLNQNQPKISKCYSNLPKPNQTQNQTLEYFKVWNILKMAQNNTIIVFEDKVLRNFGSYLVKSVFILNFYAFWKKIENFEKKFVKFSKNGFLVVWKQSRTKPDPNSKELEQSQH